MSEIALRPIQNLRSSLALTPDLATWVCAAEDGAQLPEGLPPAVIAEAAKLVAQMDRLLAPARPADLHFWLKELSSPYYAMRHPQDPDAPLLWRQTIIASTSGMPRAVFSDANIRELWARHNWLPSIAQILEVLGPDRDRLETRARALRTVSNATKLTETTEDR